MIPHFTWVLGLGMIVGLLIAVFVSYNRPRVYEDRAIVGVGTEKEEITFNATHGMTLLAVVIAFVVQLWSGSLPMGALAALIVMILTGALKWKDVDSTFMGGLEIMGLITFIMLIAAGYGNVLRETKSVEQLVQNVAGMVGGKR